MKFTTAAPGRWTQWCCSLALLLSRAAAAAPGLKLAPLFTDANLVNGAELPASTFALRVSS